MDGQIIVKTEVLVSQSEEVSKQISNTENAFSELKNLISATSSYWIGEAGEVHRTNYMNRESDVETAIRRLREHVVDLKTMAGVYDEAEKTAQSEAQNLISEVIS